MNKLWTPSLNLIHEIPSKLIVWTFSLKPLLRIKATKAKPKQDGNWVWTPISNKGWNQVWTLFWPQIIAEAWNLMQILKSSMKPNSIHNLNWNPYSIHNSSKKLILNTIYIKLEKLFINHKFYGFKSKIIIK